jgi:hypothetical protein
MKIRKLIERRIRRAAPGIAVESDVNAVVAANVGERNSVTKASSTQSTTARQGPRKAGDDAA